MNLAPQRLGLIPWMEIFYTAKPGREMGPEKILDF
jgi:hypothetical protein